MKADTVKKYGSLALWILVFEAVSGFIGSSTQTGVDTWYQTLTPPPLNPPNIVFPVVWGILYALIAAAGWTIWRNRNQEHGSKLLLLFAVYMSLNWSWSYVFFTAHQLMIGFFWIMTLNLVAFIIIAKAWPKLRTASYLMIPPTLWTVFAAYLNGGYWLWNS